MNLPFDPDDLRDAIIKIGNARNQLVQTGALVDGSPIDVMILEAHAALEQILIAVTPTPPDVPTP